MIKVETSLKTEFHSVQLQPGLCPDYALIMQIKYEDYMERFHFQMPKLSPALCWSICRPVYCWVSLPPVGGKSKGLEMGKEIKGGKKRKKEDLGKLKLLTVLI